MQIRRDGICWLVRLETGEEIRTSLGRFARDRGIRGAWITAIGAVEKARIAWFDESTGVYRSQVEEGGLEVLGLNGNLSLLEDGEVMVHLHALLGRKDLSVVGGHLEEAEVSVTLETFLHPTEAIHRRVPFGPLRLWDLSRSEEE